MKSYRSAIISEIEKEVAIQEEELHYFYEAWATADGQELDPIYIFSHTRRTMYLSLLNLTRHRWRDLNNLIKCAHSFEDFPPDQDNHAARGMNSAYSSWKVFLNRLKDLQC